MKGTAQEEDGQQMKEKKKGEKEKKEEKEKAEEIVMEKSLLVTGMGR